MDPGQPPRALSLCVLVASVSNDVISIFPHFLSLADVIVGNRVLNDSAQALPVEIGFVRCSGIAVARFGLFPDGFSDHCGHCFNLDRLVVMYS